MLTSSANPRFRVLRDLLKADARARQGLVLVEGIHPVGEVLASAWPVQMLAWSPALLDSSYGRSLVETARARGAEVLELDPRLLAQLAGREHPQGIVAAVHWQPTALEALEPAAQPFLAAIDRAQDPGNIGTILRSIDAAGAHALVLLGDTADPSQPAAVRASMGALFFVPVVRTSWEAFYAWGGAHGYWLVGSSARGAADTAEVLTYPERTILLLGSEREGLTPAQREACDVLVRLPMRGRSTSLNLAVAAGVLLYEIAAKRNP
ncbi:MAG: RNA methyltransferase [Chloroflexi bacterium]|nr:RNA methyltransferase [Chloroflexota bacterium]